MKIFGIVPGSLGGGGPVGQGNRAAFGGSSTASTTSGRSIHAAPLPNCKYRWLRAPATILGAVAERLGTRLSIETTPIRVRSASPELRAAGRLPRKQECVGPSRIGSSMFVGPEVLRLNAALVRRKQCVRFAPGPPLCTLAQRALPCSERKSARRRRGAPSWRADANGSRAACELL